MTAQQVILLILNILGGAAVIGSYVLGINGQSGGLNILWGGVPENIRPVYTVSMVLSALSYFAFIFYILFRLNPSDTVICGRFNFSVFYAIFAVMLIASAFWMPMTNMYVSNPNTAVLIGIRTVLVLVALASISLFLSLLNLQHRVEGFQHWAAVIGAGYFAFHTTVLDAILWSVLFK
jgi:hypothetical protein